MSANTHESHNHGTLRSYLTGFVFSVILTAIPFWLVMTAKPGHAAAISLAVIGFAAAQIIVHMIYFLHMNSHSDGGWAMMAMIFTIILVVITLTGSIWVMYHLNTNMMPGMIGHDMSDMP